MKPFLSVPGLREPTLENPIEPFAVLNMRALMLNLLKRIIDHIIFLFSSLPINLECQLLLQFLWEALWQTL